MFPKTQPNRLARSLAASLLVATLPAVAGAAEMPRGYILNFELSAGSVRLAAVAETEGYAPRRRVPEPGDWTVALHGDRDQVLWSEPVRHPQQFAPSPGPTASVPFSVKAPRLRAAVAFVVSDEAGVEQLRVPIDAAFTERAAAERRRFLESDERNRQQLADLGARRRTTARKPDRPPAAAADPYARLPEEVRTSVSSRLAADLERLAGTSPEILNLSRRTGLSPQKLEQLTPPSPHWLAAARSQAVPHKGIYTLSGTVRDSTTGLPLNGVQLYFYQYDAAGNYIDYIGSYLTSTSGTYSISVDAGKIGLWLWSVTGATYVRQWLMVDSVTGNTTFDISALPGVVLSGTVTDPNANPVESVDVSCYSATWSGYVSTDAAGTYSLVVPKQQTLTLALTPPAPYFSPPSQTGLVLSNDTVIDFVLELGDMVSGTITDSLGAPLSASVVLRSLVDTSTGVGYYAWTDSDGRFSIVLSRKLSPREYVLAVAATGYVRHSQGLTVNGDVDLTVVLESGTAVSGFVWDPSAQPVYPAMVRAYLGDEFVTSARTSSDGSYAMTLAPGSYRFEVVPSSSSSLPFKPLTVEGVVVGGSPLSRDFTVASAAGSVDVTLKFADADAYALSPWSGRFMVMENAQTIAAYYGGSRYYDSTLQAYVLTYTLYLDAGSYDLRIQLLGYSPITVSGISVATGTVIRDLPQPYRWTGTLRTAAGAALANRMIVSYDDLLRMYFYTSSDGGGAFNVPLTPGGFIKAYSPEEGTDILHTERLPNVVGNRNADCVLDDFPPFTDDGAVMTQIFGVADPGSRYNITILGDGYTGVIETFTDVDGDGTWDGVLYYDLNGNGVWDSGERYAVYGDASYPVDGTDPTVDNEPFTDVNGDGYPNLDDQAVFDEKSLAVVRSLFGQDFWNENYDAFNVYRLRIVSNQAGHDILDDDGVTVLARDTELDSRVGTPSRGYILSAAYSLVNQYVDQYVPATDTVIVLVNQPIPMGRATSFIIMQGGPLTSLANGYVIAHEMGHNVGGLQDEYTEYSDTYEGGESAYFRNVTTLSDPGQIPWRELISPTALLPSAPNSDGVGLFEGAYYRPAGAYRPTSYCMMVSGNRYCPVCTRSLEQRLAAIRQLFGAPTPLSPVGDVFGLRPSFAWTGAVGASHYQLAVERVDNGNLVVDRDVYALDFSLGQNLIDGQVYRWRIRPGSDSVWGPWSAWYTFSPILSIVFSDGFESGDTTSWSTTVP